MVWKSATQFIGNATWPMIIGISVAVVGIPTLWVPVLATASEWQRKESEFLATPKPDFTRCRPIERECAVRESKSQTKYDIARIIEEDRCKENEAKRQKISCSQLENPGPYYKTYLNFFGEDDAKEQIFPAWIVIFSLLAGARLFARESEGWRRIALLGGLASGGGALVLWRNDSTPLACGIGTLAGFVAALMARGCYRWVSEGFNGRDALADTGRRVGLRSKAGVILFIILAVAFGAWVWQLTTLAPNA
jgi:hypothetical protein